MLSTNYRLRLEAICKDIASGSEVSMSDMIWAQKLAKANTSARGMLSKARRLATDEDGSCLKFLDIGDPKTDKKGFSGADDIACLLYTSPSPRDVEESRMQSSA